MELWTQQTTKLIVAIVQGCGVLVGLGCTWNAIQIVLSAGIEGGAKAIASAVFRLIGALAGWLLAVYAWPITQALEPLFTAALFHS